MRKGRKQGRREKVRKDQNRLNREGRMIEGKKGGAEQII